MVARNLASVKLPSGSMPFSEIQIQARLSRAQDTTYGLQLMNRLRLLGTSFPARGSDVATLVHDSLTIDFIRLLTDRCIHPLII